jgi:hypothetical protein
MKTTHCLLETETIDQEWVTELAKYSALIHGDTLPKAEKKRLIQLFINYQKEGFNSLSAMRKAILVFDNLIF